MKRGNIMNSFMQRDGSKKGLVYQRIARFCKQLWRYIRCNLRSVHGTLHRHADLVIAVGVMSIVLLGVVLIYNVQSLKQAERFGAPLRMQQRVIPYAGGALVRYDTPPLAATLIVDRQCDTCAMLPTQLRAVLQRNLPTADVVRTIDVSTDSGMRDARALHIVSVPAIVLGEKVRDTTFYHRAERLFVDYGDYSVFYPHSLTDRVPARVIAAPPVERGVTEYTGANVTITITAFMAPDCALCATQNDVLALLRAKYGERLRIMYDFAHQSAQADILTEGVICAAQQGQLVPYLTRVLARATAWRNVQNAAEIAEDYARVVGHIDAERFRTCRANVATRTRADAQDRTFDQFGVFAVPTLFIGRERFEGVQTYQTLVDTIDAYLTDSATNQAQ